MVNALPTVLALLATGAFLESHAQPGPLLLDFDAGFSMASVSTWGTTAALETTASGNRLLVTPAAGAGWKGVTLTMPARDLSAHQGLIMTLRNHGSKGFAVSCQVDDVDHSYPWSQGNIWLEPGATDTLFVHIHRENAPAYLGNFLKGMRGLPGGYTDHWEIIDPSKVDQIKLSMFSPEAGRVFSVDDIRAWGSITPPSEAQLQAGYLPLLDTLGQFRHAEWPGKAASARDLVAQAAEEEKDLAAHAGPADWNAYGGWSGGPTLTATFALLAPQYYRMISLLILMLSVTKHHL
jgi:hypothetical protein